MITATNDPLKIQTIFNVYSNLSWFLFLPLPLFLSVVFFCPRLRCFFHPILLVCPNCCSFDQPSPVSSLPSLFLLLSVHPLFHFPASHLFNNWPHPLSLSLSLSLSPSLFCCISLSHYQQRHLDRSGDIHTSAAVLKYSDRCVNARVCEGVKYNVYTHTHIHRFMS